MSNRDFTYDNITAALNSGTGAIFNEHIYKNHRLGAAEFRVVAISPPPESYLFTKEQIMNILRLCFSAGMETELERQLREHLSSYLPPEQPDQS
jgi:hypothetical protein